METTKYRLTYGPGILIRDEPHRTFDTLDGWKGSEEIVAFDYGVVTEYGQKSDFPPIEVSPWIVVQDEVGE